MVKTKKAQYAADTAVYYVVFSIVISLLFLAFMWLLAYYSTDTSKIPEGVEYDILTERFFSLNCFGYETPEIDISQRNIIDWYKFIQDNLDYCYEPTSPEQPQFMLNLTITLPHKESSEIKTNQWVDHIGYDKEDPIDVLIYYEGKVRDGRLIIKTQWEKVRFQ